MIVKPQTTIKNMTWHNTKTFYCSIHSIVNPQLGLLLLPKGIYCIWLVGLNSSIDFTLWLSALAKKWLFPWLKFYFHFVLDSHKSGVCTECFSLLLLISSIVALYCENVWLSFIHVIDKHRFLKMHFTTDKWTSALCRYQLKKLISIVNSF